VSDFDEFKVYYALADKSCALAVHRGGQLYCSFLGNVQRLERIHSTTALTSVQRAGEAPPFVRSAVGGGLSKRAKLVAANP